MSEIPPSSQETIFTEALALPAGERRGFVERACRGDAVAVERMIGLLRGYEENSGFLETPLVGNDAAPGPGDGTTPAYELQRGDRIGHYKLLERIGEGACGVVYMADQEQPVRRRVALKIIKLGLDTHDFIARFEAERQALALMDHPHIAKVFDAGATGQGRPYFVMELIRGIPITKYCDENNLPPRARLELFIQVCHAIQHAHQKGVIHRDIKPSNILVAVNDGVAVPKVIDFGIAKATQGRLTDKTLFTRFHAFIGTPAYSSPEQAEVTNLDVDTRSDIYSLGVLLYELLTGHQPVDHTTIERLGFEEMRRLIREVEPPRPSARVSSLGVEERTTVAQRRNVAADKLALLLRSDLDWIVMRCLEKDRRRRYETASALAQDIRRHLDNEPVEARPPSAAYRTRKFIRRHKSAFVAVTGVAAALVAGLIVSSALLVRERAAHARAVAAEQVETRLRHEADAARQAETKRAGRTALNLARQLLAEGKTADALAYFVHAARKDPENRTIAARLASVLSSRNFLLPERAPFACGTRVLAMRYSTDGTSLIVGTEDGTLRKFDAGTGALTREVRLGRSVKRNGWVFARDNDAVCAVRFVDDTVAIVDLASGRMRFSPIQLETKVMAQESALIGNSLDDRAISLSPDGRWLLARGIYEIWLWDTFNGEKKYQDSSSHWAFYDISPDGKRLAQVTGDALHLRSLPDGKLIVAPIPIARHIGHPDTYLIPSFSNDGRQLAVIDPYEAIHVFDVVTGAHLRSWPHLENWIMAGAIRVLPDGRIFAGCAHSSELWDFEKGLTQNLRTLSWDLRACVPNADGKLLLMVSSAGLAQLSSTTTGELVAEETSLEENGDVVVALSPDGQQIAAGTAHGELRWLRVGGGAARPLEFPGLAAAFTHDTPSRVRWLAADHTRVLDVASGRDVASRVANPKAISSPSVWFGPDARFAVVPNPEEPWEAWDFSGEGSARVIRLAGHANSHWDSVSPQSANGMLEAFASPDLREVGVRDLASGSMAGPMVSYQHDEVVAQAVDISADGKRLVTGHTKGAVAIWDIATGRLITTLPQNSRASPAAAHFSPDGRRLLASNTWGEARLWDVLTGEPASPVFEIIAADNTAGAVFSPDGRWLATAGARGVSLWNAVSLRRVGKTVPVGVGEGSLFFSRDGTRLVAGAEVWDVPSGEQITEPTNERNSAFGVSGLQFSPDGKFLLSQTLFAGAHLMKSVIHIRPVPPPLPNGQATPEWLLRLASAVAGKSINDAEACVNDPGLTAQIEDVRRTLATLPADAPYVDWGRWILDDRADRPIAPGYTITPSEADRLAGAGKP